MPTGYTDKIKDGLTFEQFAMRCARAMGACMDMRDDSLDAPIPERFEPSSYYAESLAEAKAKLDALMSMTASEIAAAAEADYQREREYYEQTIVDKLNLSGKYHDMLEQVKRWNPPTEDHRPFQAFMIEQIETSIRHDCSTKYIEAPEAIRPTEWLNRQLEELRRSVKYREEQQQKEIERVEQRNQWLKALRESLTVTL